MDVALEYVGDGAREDFTRSHAAWGRGLRVVDVELASLQMKGNDKADVSLSVVWLKPDEATVRTTQLTQIWQDGRGGWRMVSEKRTNGDVGLLGDQDQPKAKAASAEDEAKDAASAASSRRASFQTTIIRASE